ncbi:hypothetical protein [Microbulbifer sp. TYP-18]
MAKPDYFGSEAVLSSCYAVGGLVVDLEQAELKFARRYLSG